MKKAFTLLALLAFALPVFAAPGHSVALSWADTDSGATGIGYNVYRATGACSSSSTFAKLNSTPVTSLSYTDTNVALGQTFCYQVTASLNGGPESAPSNQVTATVSLPAAPTSLAATPN